MLVFAMCSQTDLEKLHYQNLRFGKLQLETKNESYIAELYIYMLSHFLIYSCINTSKNLFTLPRCCNEGYKRRARISCWRISARNRAINASALSLISCICGEATTIDSHTSSALTILSSSIALVSSLHDSGRLLSPLQHAGRMLSRSRFSLFFMLSFLACPGETTSSFTTETGSTKSWSTNTGGGRLW